MDRKIVEIIEHINPFTALEKLEKLGYDVPEFLLEEIRKGYKTNELYLGELLFLTDFVDDKEYMQAQLMEIPEYRQEQEEAVEIRKREEIHFEYRQDIEEPVVPSFLYGKYADVKKECRKVATKLKRGMSFEEIIENHYEYLKISELEGKLVFDGPNRLIGGEKHINLFALPLVLTDKIFSGEISRDFIFDSLIDTFWGHLCLSSRQQVYNYYKSEGNRIRYLKSLFRFYKEYVHVSPRAEEYPFQISRMFLAEENRKCPPLVFDGVNFVARYVIGNLKEYSFDRDIDIKGVTFLQYCQRIELEKYLGIDFEYDEETVAPVQE